MWLNLREEITQYLTTEPSVWTRGLLSEERVCSLLCWSRSEAVSECACLLILWLLRHRIWRGLCWTISMAAVVISPLWFPRWYADLLKSYLFLLFCLDTLLYTLCLYGRNLFNSLPLRFCLLLIGFYQSCVKVCNALNGCISFRFYQWIIRRRLPVYLDQ